MTMSPRRSLDTYSNLAGPRSRSRGGVTSASAKKNHLPPLAPCVQ